jgi:hypothetical protein
MRVETQILPKADTTQGFHIPQGYANNLRLLSPKASGQYTQRITGDVSVKNSHLVRLEGRSDIRHTQRKNHAPRMKNTVLSVVLRAQQNPHDVSSSPGAKTSYTTLRKPVFPSFFYSIDVLLNAQRPIGSTCSSIQISATAR